MKPVCPSEERLKSLIMEAFDELPTANPARMQRIATTLGRKAVVKRTPKQSWLFWLLLGSSMSAAAWWAGYTFFATESVPSELHKIIKQPDQVKQKAAEYSKQNKIRQKQQTRLKPSPIIDQRERY